MNPLVALGVVIPVAMAAHAIWRFIEDQRLGKPDPRPQLVPPAPTVAHLDLIADQAIALIDEPELAPTLFLDDEIARTARRLYVDGTL